MTRPLKRRGRQAPLSEEQEADRRTFDARVGYSCQSLAHCREAEHHACGGQGPATQDGRQRGGERAQFELAVRY